MCSSTTAPTTNMAVLAALSDAVSGFQKSI